RGNGRPAGPLPDQDAHLGSPGPGRGERQGGRRQELIAGLFAEVTDPVEIVKWKEIYETLEEVTGRGEDVVNVIESIMLKMGWGGADNLPMPASSATTTRPLMESLGLARVRLHQRLPRRGELDRDGRLHPGPEPAPGGGVGGLLQLRG